MTERREARANLRDKIELLKRRSPPTFDKEKGKPIAAGTWEAFELFSDVSRKTIEDGEKFGDDDKRSLTITPNAEGKLGKAFGFDPKEAAWRTGTVGEFEALLDKRGTLVLLTEDLEFVDEKRFKSLYTMLTLVVPSNAPESGPGEAWVSFEMNCPRTYDPGFETGVGRGFLAFELGEARTTDSRERTGFGDDGVQIDNARIRVDDPDYHKPRFIIEAIRGGIIGFMSNVPISFLKVTGFAPGKYIEGAFMAHVGQIGVSFRLPEGREEEPAKERLKQRLKQLELIEDRDGLAVLARVRIRVKERESPAAGSRAIT